MNYIDALIDNCQQAKIAEVDLELVISDVSELDGQDIEKAIYIIEQIEGDINEAHEDFLKYKNKKERKCPKLNKEASQAMYVGSSTTGLKKRISQHVGYGHKDTYALNLKYWFKGEYKITVKVYNVPREVLQIIEDDISDRLKPAFGKQGGNNK